MADTIRKQPVETEAQLQKERKREASAFIRKLQKEQLVEVYGSTVYKKNLGDYFTFLINGYSVTIYFNGTYQKYPASIAKLLQKKLDAIAVSVSPINQEVRL
jgi:CTP:phosphocholine cytidylyltransferase-like protein